MGAKVPVEGDGRTRWRSTDQHTQHTQHNRNGEPNRNGGNGTRPSAPAQAALRRMRPVWRRPRFALGVALVAASVGLGAWVIERAGDGELTWAAVRDLAPGDVVAASDVRAVRMAWDGPRSTYLTQDAPVGAVVTSFVGAGELVPTAALGAAADVKGRPVVVPLEVGSHLQAGSLADLWSVSDGGLGREPVTALLATGVQVLAVERDSGVVRSGSGQVARVLVPDDVVPAVLAARASGATLTLVERPGG